MGRLVLKKDIYIIKNTVNDKVYIGQSVNVEERWNSHIYNARYENKNGVNKSVLHKAMMKYGVENFYYEILESQIENYDEREQYWIEKYHSLVPDGYNITPGGAGAGTGIYAPGSVFKKEEELMKCIEEISSTDKSFINIAKKFDCSPEVISAINSGERYKIDGMEYPLRQTRYSQDLLKQICYSLKYENDLSMNAIAKKYNIDISQLSEINWGKIHYISSEEYPLRWWRSRDIDERVVNLVFHDIVFSDLSMSEIAEKHSISKMCVSNINTGKTYHQDYITYPLRPQGDHRNKMRKNFIDRDMILQIHELLKTDISINEIADRYNVTSTTIYNINAGKIKRYIIEDVQYPIRPIKTKQPVSTISA